MDITLDDQRKLDKLVELADQIADKCQASFERQGEALQLQISDLQKELGAMRKMMQRSNKISEARLAVEMLSRLDSKIDSESLLTFITALMEGGDLSQEMRNLFQSIPPSAPAINTTNSIQASNVSPPAQIAPPAQIETRQVSSPTAEKWFEPEVDKLRFEQAVAEKKNDTGTHTVAADAEKTKQESHDWLAEEVEKQRLADEAKQKIAAEEAEQKRIAEEAEQKRIADEKSKETPKENDQEQAGALNRLFPEKAVSINVETAKSQEKLFDQRRDEEAKRLIEEAESSRPAEQLDAATERLISLEEQGLPALPVMESQMTVEQPFSEAFTQDGNRLYSLGKYAEAEKHYKAALPTMEEVLGREHLAVVDILHRLGDIAVRRGKYPEALETLQQVLVRRAVALTNKHPETLSTLNEIGDLYVKRADFDEAKNALTDALDLRRQIFGDEHKSTAETCHSLGMLYLAQGSYSDAAVMIERAYVMRKKFLTESHPDTIQSANDLGRLCLTIDKLGAAEKFLKQALEYRKEKQGEEHPEYLDTLLYYGQYLMKTGDYAAAEEALSHVLETRKKALGERHPDTAVAYNQIGSLLLETGNYDQSKRNLNQGLYISKTSLGENHPQTATCMYDFARLCWRRGVLGDESQLAESLTLFEKAYGIRRKMLGEKHADTLQSANNAGIILIGSDKAAEAETILTETLQKRKEIFGINHLGMADSCHALALCYFKMAKTGEGKQALEEELKIRANVLGASSVVVEKALAANKQILAMYP